MDLLNIFYTKESSVLTEGEIKNTPVTSLHCRKCTLFFRNGHLSVH